MTTTNNDVNNITDRFASNSNNNTNNINSRNEETFILNNINNNNNVCNGNGSRHPVPQQHFQISYNSNCNFYFNSK